MAKIIQKVADAQKRYNAKNPVKTIRMTREEAAQVDHFCHTHGLTLAQLLTQAVAVLKHRDQQQQADVQPQIAALQAALADAQRQVQTFKNVAIFYPCSQCGELMLAATQDERQEAALALVQARFGHGDCAHKTGVHRYKAKHLDFIRASIPTRYL